MYSNVWPLFPSEIRLVDEPTQSDDLFSFRYTHTHTQIHTFSAKNKNRKSLKVLNFFLFFFL